MERLAEFETLYLDLPADGVGMLTLNRPHQGNGVVPELIRDMLACLDQVDADLGIRVLVLTGAGKTFCAGADLDAMKTYLDERMAIEEEPFNARLLAPVTPRLRNLRIPTIAALNGAATAGGFDMSLACDMRIAARSARVGETYIRLGLAPGNGGAYLMPRLVGSGIAAELAFTGDLIGAERALKLGLLNDVVDDDKLLETVLALASRIAAYPRKALEATKHLLRASWETDLNGSMSASYWATSTLQYSADFREGVEAALAKRTPAYNRRDRNTKPSR